VADFPGQRVLQREPAPVVGGLVVPLSLHSWTEAALGPVWSLPPEYRWHSLVRRLEEVADQVGKPPYLQARAATELTGRVREFADQSALSSLPAALHQPVPRG
jgi:hypothetical protein